MMYEAQQQIHNRRIRPRRRGSWIPTDSDANNGKDSRSNNRADTQRRQRYRPQRLLQRVLGPLRFRDQFVDRLRCKDLPAQRVRSSNRIGAVSRFTKHLEIFEIQIGGAYYLSGAFWRSNAAGATLALRPAQTASCGYRLPLALTARSLLDLRLVLSASARTRGLRSCLLACRPLYLLALFFICNALRICHLTVPIFLNSSIFKTLEALQLGELLHQLLHAMLLKLYCNLRVIPIPFATKHDSFPVLRVPDPRPLFQPRLARRLRNIRLRSRNL